MPTPPGDPFDRAARQLGRWVPRELREQWATWRRDLATVARELRGERLPPLVVRPPRAAAPRRAGIVPRELRVAAVVRETPDATTLELEDPGGAPIAFEPGQFFTILLDVDGETLRRAYSASSSPLDGPRVAITVKRVAGGRVSGRLVDGVRAGDALRVLGPSGSFGALPAEGAPRDLVMLAGGSGITPLMSLARTVLRREPGTRVSLVYGNRREEDVIFRDALAQLAREHEGRFVVRHVLAEPGERLGARRGILDRATVSAELDALPHASAEALHLVCGPEAMMAEARAALLARGVDAARIREERFTQPHLRSAHRAALAAVPQPVRFVHRGAARDALVAPGRTLLEAGLEAGVAMPFSCTMGGCGACKVRVASGRVEMEEPNCLTPGEREGGWVLGCVARPVEPCSVEVP